MKTVKLEKLKRWLEGHNCERATTTSRDFGLVIGGKGGHTTNASIDEDLRVREGKFVCSDDYEPEHELFLGQAYVAI